MGDLGDVAGGFLDADDRGGEGLVEAKNRFGQEIDARTPGDIIEDNGQG